MKVSNDELNWLMMHSSVVEELQKNSPLLIQYWQHRIFLDTSTLKVVLCSGIYSRGTAPRYNPKENIIFFADKVHLGMSLRSWGLAENLLDEFIVDLTIDEEVVETETEELLTTEYFEKLVLLIAFIMLINRRVRKTKFPLKDPARTHVRTGV
jgi:hypothetical protein